MDNMDVVDNVVIPLLSGIYAGVGMYLMDGSESKISLFGNPINASVGAGLVVGGSSILGEYLNNMVKDKVDSTSSFEPLVEGLGSTLRPILSGLSCALLFKVADNGVVEPPLLNAFLLGSISDAAGIYSYDKIISPYYNKP